MRRTTEPTLSVSISSKVCTGLVTESMMWGLDNLVTVI